MQGVRSLGLCVEWGNRALQWIVAVSVLLGLCASVAELRADGLIALGRTSDPSRPDTSRAARDNAIQSIPLDRLSAESRGKVSWVLGNTSVFRRLPLRVVQCDPDLYVFLVQHPDVVVNIWEVLGVSHLSMRQTGPDTYQATDDIGTVGKVEFLYRSRDTNVAYVDGTYTGELFKHQVRGRGLVVLKSGFLQEADGRCYVTSRLDSFMNIEPDGVEFLTKTFQPLVGKIADNNFLQTAGFLGSISRTAEVNNPGVQRLARKLDKVQPEVRVQFAQLAGQAAARAARGGRAEGISEFGAAPGSEPARVTRGQDPAAGETSEIRTALVPSP